MLLSSGGLRRLECAAWRAYILNSMQETLDEGVVKIRDIYKTYEKVGIKDRSMIWNS